jgi:hypothetical protein
MAFLMRPGFHYVENQYLTEKNRRPIHKLLVIFRDHVISHDLWPPHSPDLTPFDFYLWGSLKGKLYNTNLHTLEETTTTTRF